MARNSVTSCSGLWTLLIGCLYLLENHSVLAQIPTYYLQDYCYRTLDMSIAKVKSGRIQLQRPGVTPRYPDCLMRIQAPVNKRLTFKFHSFDIRSPGGSCLRNFVRLYQDFERQFPITEILCNKERIPDQAYITNGDKGAVWLFNENFADDNMELVFTAFSFSPCVGGDYQCDNSHCISSDLYCNDDYDNCGDESDICLLRQGTLVGIIVAVVVLLLILAILLAIYMVRRQQKIRREKVSG